MSEECSNCKFWLVFTDVEGFCRRYPPVPFAEVSGSESGGTIKQDYFPETVSTEWCGEYKKAEEVK
jgi:hypothetical protein